MKNAELAHTQEVQRLWEERGCDKEHSPKKEARKKISQGCCQVRWDEVSDV